MKPDPTTDRNLRAQMIGEILYELQQLQNALAALRQWSVANNAILANACIESFLIHYRNIRDFLFPGKPKPNDVLARHYADGWAFTSHDWDATRPAHERARINKKLSHLSYHRATDKDGWDFDEMYTSLSRRFRELAEALPEDWRKEFNERGIRWS